MTTTSTGFLVALATLCITSSAQASKWPDAKSAHEAGRAAYDAKRYKEAAEAFRATYDYDQEPALLVSVAESYKRAGDCGQALTYYERFLEAVPAGEQHATIAARVAALRPQCPAALPSPASTRPAEAEPGGEARLGAPQATTAPQAPPAAPMAETKQPTRPVDTAPAGTPHDWQIGLEAGVSNARWGPVSTGAQPSVRITADRTWWIGALGVGVSVGGQWGRLSYGSATFAPEPYEETATTLEAAASAQLKLQVVEWLAIRLDVGGGLSWVSGFKAWNELGANGAGTAGGVTLGSARVGLGADIPLTGGLGLRVTALALSFSPAPTVAREGISQVLTLGGALGLTYGF